MSEQTEKQAPAGTEQQQPAAESNDLSISDLQAMKVIIDIASSRGAFKPNEMMAVGQTYNKLTAFLDQVSKQAEANKTGG
jgi:hypothetical protein